MIKKRELLNEQDMLVIIERLCQELLENHQDFTKTVLIGVQPRGTYFSNRIINQLKKNIKDSEIINGNIDISFYRDDLRRRDTPIVPETMDMNLSVENKNVILIDDVLYTGRSIRSAIDALMTFGRPKSVELLILIDRRFSRQLPIEPNYFGKKINALESEKVIVEWQEINGKDRVLMIKSDLHE